MTAIIGNREDKSRHLNQLCDIIDRFVMPGVTPEQRAGIREHLIWMTRQQPDLFVNCKLETVPELQLTRVILEYSFLPIPGLKSN